ncbi:MAG: hypothetical protein QF479_04795 [Candidatus Poseidoniaceae archaeon]|nr:hypothetical protein [Candidatus Poseidoniaceae archaeon]
MKSRFVLFVLLILLAPLISSSGSSFSVSENASAADACKGDLEPVRWNETMQRVAMVPHFSPYDDWWGMWDLEGEGGHGKGNNKNSGDSNQQGTEADMSLSPEPEWMYNSPWMWENTLEPLVSNHHSTLLVGNDSVGAIKVNLSANHRTTVCITLQDLDQDSNSDINADIYLLTSNEFSKYEESYYSSHSSAGWYSDVEESLSDIPPEWRSFNFLGWKTYRDAHQYEEVDGVNFALSLDGPEVFNGLFGDSDWQDFYIVIDTWDNVHDNDAQSPGAIVAADVTIITTERTLILPNFTVSLVFLVLIIGLAISPFIINGRYMRAGLETEQSPTGVVPSLNTAPEIPPPVKQMQIEPTTGGDVKQTDTGQLEDAGKQIPNLPKQ